MLNLRYKKRIPFFGFVFAAAVLAIVIIAYSISDYRKMRSRLEQSLVREGLKVIEAFESSVRAGLTGRRLWDTEKLHAYIMDTCKRSDLDFFCFVDPSLRCFYVSSTTKTNYYFCL